MEVKTIEERKCEANKKVSYRQRGTIETKKYKGDISNTKLEVLGSSLSFNFSNGEVVESAVFEKTVRDCRGKEIRIETVRRFRKIGSDEWFSTPASIGDNLWDSRFEPATEEEAISQFKTNQEVSGDKSIDSSVVEKENVVSITKIKEYDSNKTNQKKETFLQKNKQLIAVALFATATFFVYKHFKKK